MSAAEQWIDAGGVDDVDREDVLAVQHGGHALAVYHSPDGTFHATAGLCTHEQALLADGLVMGDIIECPKHNGRFNYKTGEARRAPARVSLCTYPVRVQRGRVLVDVGSAAAG